MPSLINGYEYDIFISYRQKDNKHDGWVTEFVNQLKGELEATFKEDISIYFDENPSDGLLETHSVDKSLEGKLKCLIFIPVISQTYCDSKSFAWQHEFCAFNKMAKEDQFRRDIKLNSGNVTSRILPVKIHDLDPEDKTILENELGGALRSIEFIFKSAGVNRPLIPTDNPDKNLNKTFYRDQINKVANAIKEIITALKKQSQHPEEVSKQESEAKPAHQKNLKAKIILTSAIVLAMIVLGYFFIPKLFKSSKPIEKSVAVLPFINDSPDPENSYFINGIMEEVLNNLQKIKDFRVLSRTSTDQYKGPDKPTLPEIAKKLGVNYIVEGSGQKYGNSYRLRVQLIAANNERHLWGESYEKEIQETKDIYGVQSQIAQAIAAELKAIITPDEKKLVEKVPTANLTAYDLYMKANDYRDDYYKTNNSGSYQKSVVFYKAAFETDSAFAKAYTGLANIYYSRYFSETFYKQNFLDSCLVLANIALSYDDHLDEAYYIKGEYYRLTGHNDEALDNYDKAIKYNPNYFNAYQNKGYLLLWISNDFISGLDNLQKALNLVSGDARPVLLGTAGFACIHNGFIEKAKYYFQEIFALTGNKVNDFIYKAHIEFCLENFEEALKLLNKANEIDSAFTVDLLYCSIPSGHNEEAYIAAKKLAERYKKYGIGDYENAGFGRIGYAYWQVGKKDEAEYYFNQQIKNDTAILKLNRMSTLKVAAYYDLAGTYAFLGDKVKAYQYLEEVDKQKFWSLFGVSLAKHDPLFNGLRNEERFQKFLQNIESKYQATHDSLKKELEERGML
jgi:TolB-like protein